MAPLLEYRILYPAATISSPETGSPGARFRTSQWWWMIASGEMIASRWSRDARSVRRSGLRCVASEFSVCDSPRPIESPVGRSPVIELGGAAGRFAVWDRHPRAEQLLVRRTAQQQACRLGTVQSSDLHDG